MFQALQHLQGVLGPHGGKKLKHSIEINFKHFQMERKCLEQVFATFSDCSYNEMTAKILVLPALLHRHFLRFNAAGGHLEGE